MTVVTPAWRSFTTAVDWSPLPPELDVGNPALSASFSPQVASPRSISGLVCVHEAPQPASPELVTRVEPLLQIRPDDVAVRLALARRVVHRTVRADRARRPTDRDADLRRGDALVRRAAVVARPCRGARRRIQGER